MQLVVNVVQLAALYCLICCGYVLIYRTSRVLNLAHGEFMAMGGYFLFTVTVYLIADPISSFIIACFLSLVLGFGVYFFLMRFMAGESVFAAVLVTVALGILLRGLMTLIWTSQSWHPLQNMKVENASHQLFEGAVISTFGIVMVASTVVLYLTLFLSFKFTRWGLRMRAVGEHPLLARLNPFGKRKAKPAESSQPAQAEPEPQAKIKRKQGMFSRWFKRKPKTLPRATPKVLERRSATTAKGEVSPPPFEYKELELSLGETTKAHIIATFGKPEHTFFSEGAEEILIYRRLRRIDSLYIFLDSQGLVKDYIITKRQ